MSKRRSKKNRRSGNPANAAPGKTGNSSSKVSTNTLILVAIICFLGGYIVSAILGGFSFNSAGGGAPPPRQRQLFQAVPRESNLLDSLKEQTVRNPNNAGAWTGLGNAYFDSNRFLLSIDAYTKSLEINPANPNVWTDMGIMYRRIGQARKAIENFDEAIRIDPSHQMSRFNRGIVLLHDLNDRAGARQAWEKLFEMNPDFQAQGGQSLRQLLNGLD